MRNRFPHGGEVLGASPANPVLAPYPLLDRSLSMSRQRDLLDLQAIQRIPGLVGYWKSDPQYLFEDYTTLTTPTLGGVVGKVLDLSAPQTLGSELLTNGTMDSSTSPWSSGSQSPANCTTRTIESGRLKYVCVDAGLSYSFATQTLNSTLQLGAEYQFYCELECTVPIKVSVFNNTNLSNTIFSTVYQPGTHVISRPVHLAVTTSLNIIFSMDSGIGSNVVGGTMWIDNVSLKKINPNNAVQSTTANKPILRKTPTTGIYWADSNTATSALNVALGNLGSACTVARSSAEGVTFTENVSITSTYNIAPAFSFNADVAIFNRALTDVEKALITRYMARAVPMLGSNIANAINTSLSVWSAGGTNTKEFGPDGLTITYVDNTAGYTILRSSHSELTTNLTVGVYYLLKTRIKAVGSVSFYIQNGTGTSLCPAVILPTAFEMRTIGFCAVNVGSSMVQFYNFSAGESLTIGPITLVPVL